jgi:hypothetical protein
MVIRFLMVPAIFMLFVSWQKIEKPELVNTETDNVAAHRSLYLSMFGEDLVAGEGRRTQMRMIIGEFGSDQNKHAALYEAFLNDVKSKPRFHESPPD